MPFSLVVARSLALGTSKARTSIEQCTSVLAQEAYEAYLSLRFKPNRINPHSFLLEFVILRLLPLDKFCQSGSFTSLTDTHEDTFIRTPSSSKCSGRSALAGLCLGGALWRSLPCTLLGILWGTLPGSTLFEKHSLRISKESREGILRCENLHENFRRKIHSSQLPKRLKASLWQVNICDSQHFA